MTQNQLLRNSLIFLAVSMLFGGHYAFHAPRARTRYDPTEASALSARSDCPIAYKYCSTQESTIVDYLTFSELLGAAGVDLLARSSSKKDTFQ
jgi:hypothetical protein